MALRTSEAIEQQEAMSAALSHPIRRVFGEIMGATGPETLPLLFFLHQFMLDRGVAGSIAEIGVLHGQFLSALSFMAQPGEHVVAFDLFDEQEFNLDHSGDGAEAITRANVERFAPFPENVAMVKGDSTSFHSFVRMQAIAARFGEFRFFSVDGCHTKRHTIADIALGEKLLVNGGVLTIDDYSNDGWAAVADGTAAFFATRNVRLAPIAVLFNKLVCTTISHQPLYQEAIAEWTTTPQFARHYGHSKLLTLYDHPVWHFNQFTWN